MGTSQDSMRFVVVDDDDTDLEFVRRALTKGFEGCEVVCFDNLADASDYLDQNDFDLVITDVRMQHTTASNVRLLTHNHKGKVMVMSGQDHPDIDVWIKGTNSPALVAEVRKKLKDGV